MSSTFSAPIRVNTRQTTSNDGTLSPDNTGAAVLTQQVAVGPTNPDARFYLPAGSIIHNIQWYGVTGGTSRTIVIDNETGETVLGTIDTSGTGVESAVLADGGAALYTGATTSTVVMNAGADDGVGTFSIMYTARNADGTIAPYGSGYTNN